MGSDYFICVACICHQRWTFGGVSKINPEKPEETRAESYGRLPKWLGFPNLDFLRSSYIPASDFSLGERYRMSCLH
jgi:hypothetical protein